MKKVFILLIGLFLISEVSLHAEVNGRRIVGGYQSAAGDWYWMAALVDPSAQTVYDGLFCGGSLIHSHWILTAAHCVKAGEYTNRNLDPSEIIVVMNFHDLVKETGDQIGVKRIISHPQYDNLSPIDNFDVALLELERDVSYQTISLFEDVSGLDGKTATVIGWGANNPKRPTRLPTQLMEVQIPIVSNEICNKAYNQYGTDGSNPITDQMLCAGSDGKDSCFGDSGGPLMVKDDATGLWKLAGIVSWGDTPCAGKGLYGVYSRVSKFTDFINSSMSSQTTVPQQSQLSAPKLQVSVFGRRVNLSWTSVPNAECYMLYSAPYPEASPISSADMGTMISASANLWKGAKFYVAIRAYDTVGMSPYSNIEFFVISGGK